MKLHLGCQEKYLDGYVNIDLPPEAHTVREAKVDLEADVRTLRYDERSIEEVRCHHLLEHFSRQEALVLLARWHRWLEMGGTLHVETPDFEESAKKFVKATLDEKFLLARHIFGSEEAGWATHKDYWDGQKFSYVLKKFGFTNIKVRGYRNGLAKHARNAPKIGPLFRHLPEKAYLPFLNALGNILPESFYKKFGGNKMPNVLVSARKQSRTDWNKDDDDFDAYQILSMSLTGREGDGLIKVWMQDYQDF